MSALSIRPTRTRVAKPRNDLPYDPHALKHGIHILNVDVLLALILDCRDTLQMRSNVHSFLPMPTHDIGIVDTVSADTIPRQCSTHPRVSSQEHIVKLYQELENFLGPSACCRRPMVISISLSSSIAQSLANDNIGNESYRC